MHKEELIKIVKDAHNINKVIDIEEVVVALLMDDTVKIEAIRAKFMLAVKQCEIEVKKITDADEAGFDKIVREFKNPVIERFNNE